MGSWITESPDNLETYILWDEFQKSVKLIGNEKLIWMDNWSDMGSLKDEFPVLYSLALYYDSHGG